MVLVFMLGAALLSALLTPVVRSFARRLGAVDVPEARKMHVVPVPRLGGVAVATASTLTLAIAAALGPVLGVNPAPWIPVVGGGLIVLAAGIFDDVRSISPLAKLAFQAVAACTAMSLGVRIERITLVGHVVELGIFAAPLTFAWIVAITNAFNLVDGLDGLATGLAIIAAGTCCAIAGFRGDVEGALLLAVLAGAAVGFLPYNFHPASVFLGDSGSMVFGFALAVTGVTHFQKGATALAVAVPLLVFALPLADTCHTVARRFVAGQRRAVALRDRLLGLDTLLRPDRGHIHHRLIDLGLSHRLAVLILYGLSLVLSLVALGAAQIP
jgi:UDP-GlcNAc:undecaprenyl-phosphate/decaprenyl-phosphate GlcNAc-1-phosphate transferase